MQVTIHTSYTCILLLIHMYPPPHMQVTIHTDTLNESCCVEDSIAAFKGRTIHTYHRHIFFQEKKSTLY